MNWFIEDYEGAYIWGDDDYLFAFFDKSNRVALFAVNSQSWIIADGISVGDDLQSVRQSVLIICYNFLVFGYRHGGNAIRIQNTKENPTHVFGIRHDENERIRHLELVYLPGLDEWNERVMSRL